MAARKAPAHRSKSGANDFTELLAFAELEFLTIDQAVWLACDQGPPAEAQARPTQRHLLADKRIRAELAIVTRPGEIVLFFLGGGGDPVRAERECVRRQDFVAWLSRQR